MEDLIKLIEEFPDKNFNWDNIDSNNLNHEFDIKIFRYKLPKNVFEYNEITEDFMEKNMDLISWNHISQNKNLSINIIKKYENKPWNWDDIFRLNKHIDDIFNIYFDNINWNEFSKNENLTYDFIKNHSYGFWNWNNISSNPNIYKNIIFIPIDDIVNHNLYQLLPLFPHIPLSIIEKFCDKINFKTLSYNIHVSQKFIDKFKDKIDWKMLSLNTSLSDTIILNNLDKPWNFRYISRNKFNICAATILLQSFIKMMNAKYKLLLLELNKKGTEFYFRPGNGGYEESKKDFETYIK